MAGVWILLAVWETTAGDPGVNLTTLYSYMMTSTLNNSPIFILKQMDYYKIIKRSVSKPIAKRSVLTP
jgi:hypothetical protein